MSHTVQVRRPIEPSIIVLREGGRRMEIDSIIKILLGIFFVVLFLCLVYYAAEKEDEGAKNDKKEEKPKEGPSGGAILIVKDINISGTNIKELKQLIEGQHPSAKVTCYTLEEFAKGTAYPF